MYTIKKESRSTIFLPKLCLRYGVNLIIYIVSFFRFARESTKDVSRIKIDYKEAKLLQPRLYEYNLGRY